MSEWNSKEPLVWRAAEAVVISILTVIALAIGLVMIAAETIRGWFSE